MANPISIRLNETYVSYLKNTSDSQDETLTQALKRAIVKAMVLDVVCESTGHPEPNLNQLDGLIGLARIDPDAAIAALDILAASLRSAT